MRLATLGALKLPNHSVRLMAGLLREAGFDVAEAIARAEIPSPTASEPDHDVTGLQELAFQRVFCAMTHNRPELWMELGARCHLLGHAHSYYGLALATAENAQAAIELGIRFSDLWYTLGEGAAFYDGPRLCGVACVVDEVPADLVQFTIFKNIAQNQRVLSDLWGGSFPFDVLELPAPSPNDAHIARLYPGVPITYGAPQVSWRWSVDLRDKGLAQSDEILNRDYSEKCRQLIAQARNAPDLIAKMTSLLDASQGQLSLPQAANNLAHSPRTLQRSLQQRGLTFRELANAARHRATCRLLLETKLSITRIALEVGYENVNSLNYAFKRSAGMSPRAYRMSSGRSPAHDSGSVRASTYSSLGSSGRPRR